MYRLIMDGTETVYKDPDDPGADAAPAQVEKYKLLFQEAKKDRL
jgi:hypothetical protein